MSVIKPHLCQIYTDKWFHRSTAFCSFSVIFPDILQAWKKTANLKKNWINLEIFSAENSHWAILAQLNNLSDAEMFENVPAESDKYVLYDISTTGVKIARTHANGK